MLKIRKTNLKWVEVNDESLGTYYSLRNEFDKEIAYMWFFDKHWSLTPTIYKDSVKKRLYLNYKETDLKEVQFRAVLDIQSDLCRIGNECFSYADAISDYVSKYLEELNNEN